MLNALIERAKALLMKPAETWDVIALEDVDVQERYQNWIVPLAAIGPVATFLGFVLMGGGLGFFTALINAVISFALALASVYVLALIIDALAPNFGAEKNFKQAFKVAAYAPTAAWVTGIVGLVPSLSILWILGGLYSLYLLFLGLPKLMRPPEDKGMTYTIVAILCAIGVQMVASVVVFSIAGNAMSAGSRISAAPPRSERAAVEDAMERGDLTGALAAVLGGDAGPTVDPDALVDVLPQRVAGLALVNSSVEETDTPFDVVSLTADYGRGDEAITVTITNSPMLSAMKGALGLGSSTYDRRNGRSFERLRREGDGFVLEEWDDEARRGRYGRTVGDTFMVDVAGRGVTLRDLQRAAGEFDERKLTRLPTRGS